MTSSSLKIGFAGTPEFASEALKAILGGGFNVQFALTQPDRPSGRGMRLQACAVKQLALKHNVEVLQPHSLRLDGHFADQAKEAQARLNELQPDVLVVAAYGLILPNWVLNLPTFGCLNIHASLLPRWRGAAPIHRAIEAGDEQSGVCIMQMDEGLDTGSVILEKSLPIAVDDTTASLHDKLATLGAQSIVQVLQQLQENRKLEATPQSTSGIIYAHKINKAESFLDWSQPADLLARQVRAFNPFPSAQALLGHEALKIWQAQPLSENSSNEFSAGTIIRANATDGIVVACNGSALALKQLQRAGGKRLDVRDFLNGTSIKSGDRFELPSASH